MFSKSPLIEPIGSLKRKEEEKSSQRAKSSPFIERNPLLLTNKLLVGMSHVIWKQIQKRKENKRANGEKECLL